MHAKIILLVFLYSVISPILAANSMAAEDFVRANISKKPVKAPAFSVITEHEKITLLDFSGKLIILNFWSTDCQPCRKEMPSLNTLGQKYKKQGLKIIAISVNDSWSSVNEFKKKYDLNFPLLIDNDRSIRQQYEVDVIPLTYLIGRNGRLIARFIGERDWMHKDMQTFIQSYLGDLPEQSGSQTDRRDQNR
jgi:peroxiredoxin